MAQVRQQGVTGLQVVTGVVEVVKGRNAGEKGAAASGIYGAQIGATIGAFGGPVGVLVGAGLGAVAGGLIGRTIGRQAGRMIGESRVGQGVKSAADGAKKLWKKFF